MYKRYLNLVEFADAKKILQEQAGKLLKPETETIAVRDSLHRVLHAPVFARISHPNYNASAMDGVAINAESSFGAHERHSLKLTKGIDFWPVDTGDCLPANCNAVVMIEDVIELDQDTIELYSAVHPWQNVRVVGEDIIVGDMIVPGNHCIQAVDIGAILCSGNAEVTVRKKLQVGIVPTGTELRTAATADRLQPGEIIDSNSEMLAALIREAGATAKIYDIVPDNKELLRAAFLNVANESDIVLIIAGSSAGTEDYTQPLVAELGEVFVHGIAIKPGKPVVFGKISEKLVLGMPGYPVAAFMIAREFLQPLLRKQAGLGENILESCRVDKVDAILSRRLISSLKHQEFVQVKLGRIKDKLIATPLNRGAGVTMSLVKADGILDVARASEGIESGTKVKVQLIRPLEMINNALICTGSHDIIIDKINAELTKTADGWTLASAHVGSLGGIMAIKRGEAHIAPAHLLDEATGEYNISYIKKYLREIPVVLIRGIKRQQGLYFRRNEQLSARSLAAIAEQGLSFANRQKGSGTRVLLDYLLKQDGIPVTAISGYEQELLTHTAVALAVLSGNYDTGMGIEAVANLLGLDFVPVGVENYDLIVPQEYLEDVRIQKLLEILRSGEFKNNIESMGGYVVENIELIPLNSD
ncbi:MAG: molybdopterin biosynthesis protein [Negativicutes bacterium]|jgi:putative molybdopterin biosynthesis protein